MKISTRGQYALQMMLDLAVNDTGECITIKSIAARQNLSEKYLEQIVNQLTKAGYVKSVRGAKGGYRLIGSPEKYTVGMVLRTIEGSMTPVDMLEDDSVPDTAEGECLRSVVWTKLNDAISDVIDNITIGDLVNHYQNYIGYDYII